MRSWLTGEGKEIKFEEVMEIVGGYVDMGGAVSVGTDSFINKNGCIFTSAICLHGAKEQKGGRYFFKKKVLPKKDFLAFSKRIIFEVQESIELGAKVLEFFPDMDIELHMDISSADKNNKTSKLATMLIGYASGAGFKYRIKPDAYAAASVADKHSKND